MRGCIVSSLPSWPSLRVGALSLPHGSAEEGAACSVRNSHANCTEVALFHLGHHFVFLCPKALHSQGMTAASQQASPCSHHIQNSAPLATLQFLGK